jgi:branched-chain amino acid transport system ATP-binding protein
MALAISHRGYVHETGAVILEGTASELAGNDLVRQAYLGG